QSYGLVIALWSGALLGLTATLLPARRAACFSCLLAVGGFGLLGLLDDTWGDRRIKGLKGHFRAALREQRITRGFVKAVGGALLALLLGFRARPDSPANAVLAAALIPLSANSINLLDLRPGRAGGVFLAVSLLTLGYTVALPFQEDGVPLLLYV